MKNWEKYIPLGIIVTLTIIILILISGIAYNWFVVKPQKEIAQLEVEKVSQEVKLKENKDKNLNSCLIEAEEEFKRLRDINSTKNPSEEHPDARQWNSTETKVHITEQYNKDRDFCLDLYE